MNFDLTTISSEMPGFDNHIQARDWFKNQFDERFTLKASDLVEGKKVYTYHLIKNTEQYQQYMESFAKPVKHEITNADTFESYSTV